MLLFCLGTAIVAQVKLGVSLQAQKGILKELVMDAVERKKASAAGGATPPSAPSSASSSSANSSKGSKSAQSTPIPTAPQRVVLRGIIEYAFDFSRDGEHSSPALWVRTDAAWYRIADMQGSVSPAAWYRRLMRPMVFRLETQTRIRRMLTNALLEARARADRLDAINCVARTLEGKVTNTADPGSAVPPPQENPSGQMDEKPDPSLAASAESSSPGTEQASLLPTNPQESPAYMELVLSANESIA